MPPLLRLFLWCALLLALPALGFARTWTDITGTYHIDAEFVDVVEGKVQLKRTDGAVIAVPLEKLSDQDRDHIKRLLAESLKSAPQASRPFGSEETAEPAAKEPPAEKPAAAKPPARTGQFQTSFSEHSPLAARTTMFPRMVQPRELNPAAMEYQKQLGPAFNSEYFYEPDKETWQVYVPDDYDGTVPYGLFVFITGDDDMNRSEMQGHAKRMLGSGFRFVSYLQIPNHGHSGPPGDWFEKGILALDAPLREAAQGQYEAAQKAMERQQWDRALPSLQAAAAHGHDQPFGPEALKALQEIQAKYDTDIAAVERLLTEGNLSEANKQLSEFRKAWPQTGRSDAKRLGGAIQKARRTQ